MTARGFSLTPPDMFALDVPKVSQTATSRGFRVENQGSMGLSLRTDEISVSFMNRGSAVIVGAKDEEGAVKLYFCLDVRNKLSQTLLDTC